MGQKQTVNRQSKRTIPKPKDVIPELEDVTLKGVEPALNIEESESRGRGQQSKRTIPKPKDVIPELENVTLKGVEPLNIEGSELRGRGSYGIVFTVKHDGTDYAAKKIHPILIEHATDEEKRIIKDAFIQECLSLSSIRHPNIVRFVGVYYQPAQSSLPIMVMELMDTNLKDFVETKKSEIFFSEKISILHDVSVGLDFLHSHDPQIIHRDLSSNNVLLLTRDLTAKIADLGVAKIIRAGKKATMEKLRLSRAVPGTPHFMPPEVMEVDSVYNTSIDVFSFGGIALHLFSEEWPAPSATKQKDPDTNMILTLSEVKRRQQYLDKMTGEADELRKMVKQCLDDDPDKRPTIQKVSKMIELFKVAIPYS